MKKFAGLLLTVLMICATLPFTASAADYYDNFSGNGTDTSPYLIQNSSDWDVFVLAVTSDPNHGTNTFFRLTGDIGSKNNGINTYVDRFFGVFDGNGRTIWHGGTQSLFNKNSGEIRNIVVRNSKELFFNFGGTICYYNNGIIDRCVNYAPITVDTKGGGICGTNNRLIVNCINYAPVNTTNVNSKLVGGICGQNQLSGIILNCINTATVSGSGICGFVTNDIISRINICFNCGQPSGYGIAQFQSKDWQNFLLYGCSILSPINGIEYTASNNESNNASLNGNYGGNVTDVEHGVSNMNKAIENYDNPTECRLFKWKVGENGLPTFDEAPTGSVLSDGNIWIIIAVAALAVGGVAVLFIVKKKKKPALASGENNDEE